MNEPRETGQGRAGAEQPLAPRDEPEVVRIEDWVRRRQRHRPVEPDDDPDGPEGSPAA